MQAQDYAGALWAVGARVRGAAAQGVEAALDRGDVLRTHVLRPTWHLVARADVRWMLALSAPRIRAALAPYDRKLDLDAAVLARSRRAIARALRGGASLTRAELGGVLARAGVAAEGQRLGNLLMHAEIDAVVVSGPRRGKHATYALLAERAPDAVDLARDAALGVLARRYFTSRGPATVADFAWWSGLSRADAEAGASSAAAVLARHEVGGRTYFTSAILERASRAPSAHLLPPFDEYVVAYKDRGATLPTAEVPALGRSDLILSNPLVVVDGGAVGTWRRTLGARGVALEAHVAAPLDDTHAVALANHVARYAAFLGLPAELTMRVTPRARPR